MQKNVASQKWIVFAFEDEGGTNPGEPVTGDAANITANVRIDGGAANAVDDTNPTELEDGYYIFDITAAESNGDLILIAPASSTANVNVIGVPGAVYTTPPNFPALGIESDGDVTKVNTLDGHTAQTGDNYARLGAPTGASIAADIGTAQTDLDTLTGSDGATLATSQPNYAPATAAALATVDTNVDTLLTRITSTLFTGITSLAEWLGAMAGKQVADSTARTELRATGAGSGTFDETTDSMEAISDSGGGGPTAVQIRQEMDSNSTQLAAIVADTGELQGDWADGGRLDLILDARASQATADAIEVDTQDLQTQVGTAGAGLTGVPWNAAWNAEVQSEVDDALKALGLDHLLSASVAGTDITDDSIFAKLVSKSAPADWDDFVNTTDSLQAARDKLTDVEADTNELQGDWADGGRLDLILDARASQATADAIETDTQDLQTQVGAAGAGLTALPWNAAWNAEVESEVNDALVAYDVAAKSDAASPAEVASEVSDALRVDTLTAASGVPSATPTFMSAVMWTHALSTQKMTFNKSTGVHNLRNAADTTTIGTYTATDDGTTYTRPNWS